jgi:alkylated DNA nucleotide flippase Atl1
MTSAERGIQIWVVLCGCAHNRQTLTYKGLAKLIGMGAGTLARPLGHVMRYCESNDLPALTSLVVKTGGGTPGIGLTSVRRGTMDAMREQVFNHNWYDSLPPAVTDLESA